MAADTIHILLVDDDHEDYLITRTRFQQIKDQKYELEWADGFEKGYELIMEGRHDVYLLDYRLGARNGLELLKKAVSRGCEAPMILLTGQGDREIDLQAMRSGAADYLVKSELQPPLLERSIRYALERRKSQEALRESEERYRDLLENANDMIQSVDPDGAFLYVNTTWKRIMGYTDEEIRKLTLIKAIHPEVREAFSAHYERVIAGEADGLIETAFITKNQKEIFVQGSINCRFDEGKFVSTRSIFRDITGRKIAEKERDRLFELSHDLIAIVGFNLKFADVNPSWSRLLGYSISELRDMNLTDLIHQEDLVNAKYQIDLLREGKVIAPFEVRFRCIDNTYKWLSCSFTTEREEQVLYLFARDITDIKKSQIELLENERRYRELVENSYGVIFTHDLNGKILSANRAFSKLLGYEAKKIIGQNLSSFLAEEELPQFYQYLEKISREQQTSITAVFLRENGDRIHMAFSNFLYHPQNGASYVIANAHDITNRVKAERALELERQQLLKVIANAPVPMALLDKDLKFITHSRKWIDEFKPDKNEDIVGISYRDAYSFVPGSWVAAANESLQGKILAMQEDVVYIPGEGKRYFRWAMHPWRNPEGQIEGIITVIDPIYELVRARMEAEQASRSKSVFLANITHELRTPLNAVLGYAQILSNDPTIGESQREYIDNMYYSALHLTGMINDILDLSKIEAGKMDMNIEPASFAAIIDEVHGLFNLKSREKGLKLLVEKDKELSVLLKMDPAKIRQILINLVGNAVKFTDTGHVRIAAKLRKSPRPGKVRISLLVEDTGRGIPKEQIPKIFEPFRQVKGMSSEGTGLGLTITQHLIKMMKGELTVESTLGRGSAFSVIFDFEPVKSGRANDKKRRKYVRGIKGRRQWKVLIADPVDYQRKNLRAILQKAGFVCHEAASEKELEDKVQLSKPDIIFIDEGLEDDNIESSQQIINEFKQLKITKAILLTQDTIPEQDSGRRFQVDAVVSRPYKEDQVFETLKQAAGVRFEYATFKGADSVPLNEMLDRAIREINKLPDDFRGDLLKALEYQDLDKIDQLADSLSDGKKPLADLSEKLKNAVKSSDYYLITYLGKKLLQDT